MTSPNFVPIAIGALFAWRIFGRMRRNIGRQPLQPKRMTTRIVIYACVTCLLVAFSVV